MAKFLITGVSRGVGRTLAEQLVAAGHQVYGIARSPAAAEGLGLAGSAVLELTALGDFPAALEELLASVTVLDGLVHCAGIVRPGPLAQAAPQDFLEQFTVNVAAVAELTRLWLPALRAAGGTVVLVNSGSGLQNRAPLAVYGTSKYALRGYAEALRQEEPGLRVSTVYPGRIATDMQRAVREAEAGDYDASDYLDPTTVAGVISSVLTLPTDATITDLTLRPRRRRPEPC